MSVDVHVVTLPVTVRDKHGKIVRDLTKDEFVLEEDGRPQTIRYFSLESNLPLTLGLLVDTSLSQQGVLDQERTASKSFLDQMLTMPSDQAFLIHFDLEVELLQDLTPTRDKLRAALELLRAPTNNRDSGSDGGASSPGAGSDPDSGRSRRMRGTLLYDAIFLASEDLMKKQHGRKALIILSDGVDRGSEESLETAIASAQRADTMVYSILFVDHNRKRGGDRDQGGGGMGRSGGGWPGGGWPGGGGRGGGGRGRGPGGGGGGQRGGGQRRPEEPRADGKKTLERISKESGGRLYEVSKKGTVEQIYASIAEELRTQYGVGYTPDKANAGAGYHKVSLITKQKNLSVQTRDGYYSER